jgi:hypothetical protein
MEKKKQFFYHFETISFDKLTSVIQDENGWKSLF